MTISICTRVTRTLLPKDLKWFKPIPMIALSALATGTGIYIYRRLFSDKNMLGRKALRAASAIANGLGWKQIHITNPNIKTLPEDKTALKIATLNILGFPGTMPQDFPGIGGLVSWKERARAIESAICKADADVICLQEVIGESGKALRDGPEFSKLREKYGEIHVFGNGYLFPGGPAILSKHKVDAFESIPFDECIQHQRSFGLVQIGDMVIVSAHLESGNKDKRGKIGLFGLFGDEKTVMDVRNAQAQQIIGHLNKNYSGKKCFVLGDVNCNQLDPAEYDTFPFNPKNNQVIHCATEDDPNGFGHKVESDPKLHKIIPAKEIDWEALSWVPSNHLDEVRLQFKEDDLVCLYQELRPLAPLAQPYRTSSSFFTRTPISIETHNQYIDESNDDGGEALDTIVFVKTGHHKMVQFKDPQRIPMFNITQPNDAKHQTSDHHMLVSVIYR